MEDLRNWQRSERDDCEPRWATTCPKTNQRLSLMARPDISCFELIEDDVTIQHLDALELVLFCRDRGLSIPICSSPQFYPILGAYAKAIKTNLVNEEHLREAMGKNGTPFLFAMDSFDRIYSWLTQKKLDKINEAYKQAWTEASIRPNSEDLFRKLFGAYNIRKYQPWNDFKRILDS